VAPWSLLGVLAGFGEDGRQVDENGEELLPQQLGFEKNEILGNPKRQQPICIFHYSIIRVSSLDPANMDGLYLEKADRRTSQSSITSFDQSVGANEGIQKHDCREMKFQISKFQAIFEI
jgi:hypothetical protein